MMAPDGLPRKMTLERVLLAAVSAVASALATFSFLTWRKRRKVRPPHVTPCKWCLSVAAVSSPLQERQQGRLAALL